MPPVLLGGTVHTVPHLFLLTFFALPVIIVVMKRHYAGKDTIMGKFSEDFKAFIAKGNVLDMAVGVVVGGAFNKIVTSLVNDIIMPLVGLLMGGLSVADWKWVIREAVLDEAGAVVTAENALKYGNFMQTVIDFLIVAFTIFVVLRVFVKLQKKKEEEAK